MVVPGFAGEAVTVLQMEPPTRYMWGPDKTMELLNAAERWKVEIKDKQPNGIRTGKWQWVATQLFVPDEKCNLHKLSKRCERRFGLLKANYEAYCQQLRLSSAADARHRSQPPTMKFDPEVCKKMKISFGELKIPPKPFIPRGAAAVVTNVKVFKENEDDADDEESGDESLAIKPTTSQQEESSSSVGSSRSYGSATSSSSSKPVSSDSPSDGSLSNSLSHGDSSTSRESNSKDSDSVDPQTPAPAAKSIIAMPSASRSLVDTAAYRANYASLIEDLNSLTPFLKALVPSTAATPAESSRPELLKLLGRAAPMEEPKPSPPSKSSSTSTEPKHCSCCSCAKYDDTFNSFGALSLASEKPSGLLTPTSADVMKQNNVSSKPSLQRDVDTNVIIAATAAAYGGTATGRGGSEDDGGPSSWGAPQLEGPLYPLSSKEPQEVVNYGGSSGKAPNCNVCIAPNCPLSSKALQQVVDSKPNSGWTLPHGLLNSKAPQEVVDSKPSSGWNLPPCPLSSKAPEDLVDYGENSDWGVPHNRFNSKVPEGVVDDGDRSSWGLTDYAEAPSQLLPDNFAGLSLNHHPVDEHNGFYCDHDVNNLMYDDERSRTLSSKRSCSKEKLLDSDSYADRIAPSPSSSKHSSSSPASFLGAGGKEENANLLVYIKVNNMKFSEST